jgi:hypothetical protein
MLDQSLVYFIEHPLMIISINSWRWGGMVIRLVINFGELVKVALKSGGQKKWYVGALRGMGAAGFCGICVCLGVFLLL